MLSIYAVRGERAYLQVDKALGILRAFPEAGPVNFAGRIRRLVVTNPGGLGEPLPVLGFAMTALVVFLAHLPWTISRWKQLVASLPRPALGAVYALGLNVALMLAPLSDKLFIYFQF